ncbi:MAG TPA: hypothetical protein PKA00_13450 [Saprospiraceae bacterium]|nr:hypothetical protein [Saprospiraceae bacterium]HMQ83915.1 hypothetical protein [Saprospiraceae bacterium]
MENLEVTKLMRLITPLSLELKLEVLSKISDNIKASLKGIDSRTLFSSSA